MLKRAQTNRSMTVKLKTMKTADLDINDQGSQELLNEMADDQDQQDIESFAKVSKQQKLKFIMHWIILISSHYFVFFYIPFKGNDDLYGPEDGPLCDDANLEKFKYGCRNFHSSIYLIIFYTLICAYLWVSAIQMRYGFPTFKIASSIMASSEWYYGILGIIYMQIPFAAELRCLFDFVFTNTALDIFQYWQLFNYHIEMFCAKCGNSSYEEKVYSAPVLFEDLIIGYALLFVLMFLLIGPILLFSEYAFTGINPVHEAHISVALVVSKKLSMKNLVDRSVWKWEADQANHKKKSVNNNIRKIPAEELLSG